METKMYRQNGVLACQFGPYRDETGDYSFECDFDIRKNQWMFFKCYDDETVETSERNIPQDALLYVQCAILQEAGRQGKPQGENIQLVTVVLDDKQKVVYAINKTWLRTVYPNYGSDLTVNKDKLVIKALIEKQVAFIYRPGTEHPFMFFETYKSQNGYAMFADMLAQVVQAAGHDDAAGIIKSLASRLT